MEDYTDLGRSKIAMQGRRNLREIRCPRDGAVMRVMESTVVPVPQGVVAVQRIEGLPRRRGWAVIAVDVRCPACRRTANQVSVADEDVATGTPPTINAPNTRFATKEADSRI